MYGWSSTLDEWFVNDARGLEHGFTVRERPEPSELGEVGSLNFVLSVRGDLLPRGTANRRGVRFTDSGGAVIITYAGLTVFDADGGSSTRASSA